jgi:hypothetical protein
MRTTTAYFAGVGTVAIAIAAGLGGGLLFSNIVAPHQPKYAAEPTKLEQRMTDRSTSAPSEPTPYLAATQSAATTPVVAAAPAPTESQTPLSPPAAAAPPAEPKTASNTATAEQPVSSSAPQVQRPAEPVARELAAREPAASPREAFAKARDADIRRAATEKRRAERHQQWADKRRDRQPRAQELEAVEQSVRDATEPREAFMAEPARLDVPRIRLFGDD